MLYYVSVHCLLHSVCNNLYLCRLHEATNAHHLINNIDLHYSMAICVCVYLTPMLVLPRIAHSKWVQFKCTAHILCFCFFCIACGVSNKWILYHSFICYFTPWHPLETTIRNYYYHLAQTQGFFAQKILSLYFYYYRYYHYYSY